MHLTDTLDCAHHPKTDTQHTEMSHNHKIKPLLPHSYLVNTKCLSENHSGMIYLKKTPLINNIGFIANVEGMNIQKNKERWNLTQACMQLEYRQSLSISSICTTEQLVQIAHTALSQSCLPPRPPNTQTHTHAHRSCQKPSSFSMSLV